MVYNLGWSLQRQSDMPRAQNCLHQIPADMGTTTQAGHAFTASSFTPSVDRTLAAKKKVRFQVSAEGKMKVAGRFSESHWCELRKTGKTAWRSAPLAWSEKERWGGKKIEGRGSRGRKQVEGRLVGDKQHV